MKGSFSETIQAFCESNRVAVPPGFQRRPANRWAMIRVDSETPRLVAATFATPNDAQYYLRRELHYSDFGVGSDLPVVALDAETRTLHPITRDCTIADTCLTAIPLRTDPSHGDVAVNAHVEVIGVHKIASREPCHLIEVVVRDAGGPFSLGDFTQEWPGKDPAGWQVAYAAKFLDQEGVRITGNTTLDKGNAELWASPTRIAFFFHYLDLGDPLQSPFGDIHLPPPSPMPERLRVMRYEPVD
ncbi:hypothetical protein LCGC14_2935330 [marine sediment metagenome]|uniref:Uncharacterized protein n=1 Tax=marine sediment metagenome TaxID=412755 RepID=A0A0F8ZSA2_9ZZZZ